MRHARVVLFSAALALFLANGPSARAGERVLTLDNGVDATLNVPDGVTNAPAVLMLHGFGSQKNEVGDMYAREARALADKGVASLRISFRGFGKSDGDTGSATIDQMVSDALAAGPIDGYVKLAPAATKEAVIIPGADHIYEVLTNDQTDADHVIAITAEWFAKTL